MKKVKKGKILFLLKFYRAEVVEYNIRNVADSGRFMM